MWQICQNLLKSLTAFRKSNKACTHPSVTSLKPDLHGSGETLYTDTTRTLHPTPIYPDKPNPTEANNLHSPNTSLEQQKKVFVTDQKISYFQN